jgi:hypothetical protein
VENVCLRYDNNHFVTPKWRIPGRSLRNTQDKVVKKIMPLIKSLFTALNSRIIYVINWIESYDTVIEAAKKVIWRELARTKVHPGKVRNDGQKLSYQLETHIEI